MKLLGHIGPVRDSRGRREPFASVTRSSAESPRAADVSGPRRSHPDGSVEVMVPMWWTRQRVPLAIEAAAAVVIALAFFGCVSGILLLTTHPVVVVLLAA